MLSLPSRLALVQTVLGNEISEAILTEFYSIIHFSVLIPLKHQANRIPLNGENL